MTKDVELALKHRQENINENRWARLNIIQKDNIRENHIQLEVGYHKTDGRRESVIVTYKYYIGCDGNAKYVTYAHS